MTDDDKVFVEITNRDIFEGIQEMKKGFQQFKLDNSKQHQDIISHQKTTNGRVTNAESNYKRLYWLVGIILVFILGLKITGGI